MKSFHFLLFPLVLTFLLTACANLVTGYKTENGKVYFYTPNSITGTSTIEVEGADAATFKELPDPRYGRDKNHVYMGAGVVVGADPVSFRTMDKLSLLGMSKYARDNRHIFREGSIVPGADPATFKALKGEYAIDHHQVYYDGAPFTTDTKGFAVIDEYYARDSSDVYLMGNPLGVCSVQNFEFVFPAPNNGKNNPQESSSEWARDGCDYFFAGQKMPSADYANVTVLQGSMGIMKDSRTAYLRGRDLRYNVSGERLLDTLDVATFTVVSSTNCSDKFGPINVFCGRQETCD